MSPYVSHQQVQFEHLLKDLRVENSRFDRELRSCHREVLITPVKVIFLEQEGIDQNCVSRNISSAGISLISALEMEEGISATLEVYRLTKAPNKQILADCRWCKPFGKQFWMSGWQFMQIKPIN